MDIPGLGGCKCVEKGVRIFGPLFPKNIGLGFSMGFHIWLRLAKNAMKRGWEGGVRILLGMKRLDPDRMGRGAGPKLSYRRLGGVPTGKSQWFLCA